MIQDLANLDDRTRLDADVCLIGAGAAGITLAQALAGSRLRVVLVESGGLDLEAETQALFNGESVGYPCDLEVGRLRMFGGTTNHWGARCAKLDALDFRKRSWVPNSGWPIDRETLNPYYDRALKVVDLDRSWGTPEEICSHLGVKTPQFDSPWVEPFYWRYSTQANGDLTKFGVKYRGLLNRADNVRVLLHANAVNLQTTALGSDVTALEVRALNGRSATISAKRFVVCAGGLENARILLNGSDHRPIGARSGQLGRYFTQHIRGVSGTVQLSQRMPEIQNVLAYRVNYPKYMNTEIGLCLSQKAQTTNALLNCSATLTYTFDTDSGLMTARDIWKTIKEQARWPERMGEKVGNVVNDLDSIAANLKGRNGNYRLPVKSAKLTLDLEQAPQYESAITLVDKRDALGVPLARVDWRVDEQVRRTARMATTYMGNALAAQGVGRMRLAPWVLDPNVPLAQAGLEETFHYYGTTRMSASAAGGVVDPNCRVHGVDNLYVLGASVFPTGGHANPTLTIVALSLRLADHLSSTLIERRTMA